MSHLYEEYDYSLFESRFRDYNRYEAFGYLGLKALFEYLESLAEDTGTPIKVDVIGLCCDFSVYTEAQCINDFGDDWRDDMPMVIDLDDDTFLIQS